MQMQLEEKILALREGAPAAPKAEDAHDGAPAVGPFSGPPVDMRHHAEQHADTHAGRVRALVWDVINHETDDIYRGQRLVEALHERLIESDRFDAFLYRPLKEGVEAVCADLGLTPDWSRWTGEGWAPSPIRRQWELCWDIYDPRERARERSSGSRLE
jgi:hypothetical protein